MFLRAASLLCFPSWNERNRSYRLITLKIRAILLGIKCHLIVVNWPNLKPRVSAIQSKVNAEAKTCSVGRAVVEDQISQRGRVVRRLTIIQRLRAVFRLQLPRAVVLGLLPTAVEVIYLFVRLGFNLPIKKIITLMRAVSNTYERSELVKMLAKSADTSCEQRDFFWSP